MVLFESVSEALRESNMHPRQVWHRVKSGCKPYMLTKVLRTMSLMYRMLVDGLLCMQSLAHTHTSLQH